jgi:hypothetical protein
MALEAVVFRHFQPSVPRGLGRPSSLPASKSVFQPAGVPVFLLSAASLFLTSGRVCGQTNYVMRGAYWLKKSSR